MKISENHNTQRRAYNIGLILHNDKQIEIQSLLGVERLIAFKQNREPTLEKQLARIKYTP